MKLFFKRALSIIVLFALIIPALPVFSVKNTPALSAKSAILIDASDTSVLYEKNAHERMGMASTTKIMTALVVSEAMPLDKTVSIPKEAVNIEGSSVYLCEGEILSVRELLFALLLASANDAAAALAIACSGSIEAFADEMNEKADALGLCDTHFTNPHVLYDEMHYTTAYDLAIITKEAMQNHELCEIFASKKATIPQGVSESKPFGLATRYLQNHNKLLKSYEGAIGVKTGFTKKTGRCLVSAAERDGLRLIAVTLSAPDDWRDHTSMLDYGFENYESVTFFDVGEFTHCFPVSNGQEDYVTLTNEKPIRLTQKKGEQSSKLTVLSCRRFELAPIDCGAELATLELTSEGKSATSPLIAAHSVQQHKNNSKLKDFLWNS